MHNDQDQESRASIQPHDANRLEKDRLEQRTQRDQEERSKQALSNQGSQDRKRKRSRTGADHPNARDRGDSGQ